MLPRKYQRNTERMSLLTSGCEFVMRAVSDSCCTTNNLSDQSLQGGLNNFLKENSVWWGFTCYQNKPRYLREAVFFYFKKRGGRVQKCQTKSNRMTGFKNTFLVQMFLESACHIWFPARHSCIIADIVGILDEWYHKRNVNKSGVMDCQAYERTLRC